MISRVNRWAIVAVSGLLVFATLGGSACTSDDEPKLLQLDLSETDCFELEAMASAEVDTITASSDPNVVEAATQRYVAVIDRINDICN